VLKTAKSIWKFVSKMSRVHLLWWSNQI